MLIVLHQFFDVLASWEVENACLSYVFNVFETREVKHVDLSCVFYCLFNVFDSWEIERVYFSFDVPIF